MSLLSDLLDPARNHGAMRLIARPLYSWSLDGGGVPDRLVMLPPDPWMGDLNRGRSILNRSLDYNGIQLSLAQAAWSDPAIASNSRHCMAVHGFEWLRDLRSLSNDTARKSGRDMLQEWMDVNTSWQESIWDYAVTARRVSAWLMNYDFFCASGDDAFLNNFYMSLIRQIRHLDRAQPDNITGFEGLLIIKASLFAGLCIEDGSDRLQNALDTASLWIKNEMDAEGMHLDRNVSTVMQIAQCLIDMRAALVRGGHTTPVLLQTTLERTLNAIRFFRMPDGKLACFQGSCESEAATLETLLKIGGVRIKKAPTQLEESGFESLIQEKTVVVADCGYAPAAPHDKKTHASPLAFEMCVGRDRMIVSCGAYPDNEAWEDHLRATAAHSGLTIDDRNAMEIRPDGHVGRAPNQMIARRDIIQGGIMLTMSHDGYVPLNGLVHTRRLKLATDGTVLQGEDGLVSDAPLMKPVNYTIRFHLHPRVQASLIKDGNAALLRLPSGAGWRFNKNAGVLSLESSVYCGASSQPRKTQQLVINGLAQGSTAISWMFSEEK